MNRAMQLFRNKASVAFIFLQVFYTGITTVVNIFVNTFLLKSMGSTSNQVLFYNLIIAATQPIAMIIAISLAKKGSLLVTQRIGFVFYGIACIFMAIYGEKIAPLYYIIAILMAFGAGFYFTAYSRQMISYVLDETRDLFSGLMTFLSMIISITVPLLSGFLMTKFGFFGYKLMFIFVAVLAVSALISSKFLAPLQKSENDASFLMVAKTILKNSQGRKVMIASGIDNCRTFTIMFYITLLIYKAISNEMLVSINSVTGSIAGLIGALIYGIIITKKRRYTSIFVAVTVITTACIPILFNLSPITIMIFYAVNSLCSIYISTPILNGYFSFIEKYSELKGKEAEVHTVREIFVTLGRAFGIILILLIPQTKVGVSCTLLVLVLSCMLAGRLMKETLH